MLKELLREDRIILDMKAETKEEALKELIDVLDLPDDKKEILFKSLMQREILGSTGIGKGIAIPHSRSIVVDNITLVVGISKKGVDFEALDGKPVHLFFMLIATPNDPSMKYLSALGSIARVSRSIVGEGEIKTDFSSPKEVVDYILSHDHE